MSDHACAPSRFLPCPKWWFYHVASQRASLSRSTRVLWGIDAVYFQWPSLVCPGMFVPVTCLQSRHFSDVREHKRESSLRVLLSCAVVVALSSIRCFDFGRVLIFHCPNPHHNNHSHSSTPCRRIEDSQMRLGGGRRPRCGCL